MDRIGEGTKFTLDRKIFSSDIWFASPWKLKIWVYLIGNANHTDGQFKGIPIKRGQLIRSYRKIAEDCGYYIGYRYEKPSVSTVKRICEDFTKDARTAQRTTHAGTLFTICNYNELQSFPKSERHNERTGSGTTAEQNKNDKEEKKKTYSQNSIEFRLSKLLLDLILERRNSFKKPNLQIWAKHVAFMIRDDKRPPEEIEQLIRWSQKDSFWQDNILSTAKLRTQFDQLSLKMSKDGLRKKEQIDDEPPYWS